MNTRITTYVKICTSFFLLIGFSAGADWNVDFSRRLPSPKKEEIREPASEIGEVVEAPAPTFVEAVFSSTDPAQEIVVLNTDKGFVPSQLRVKQGQTYKIFVVNVNENEKNISFVLDAFSEHHATYFGKLQSFVIRPTKEGVFRFVSPETAAVGKLVVAPEEKNGRLPASTP